MSRHVIKLLYVILPSVSSLRGMNRISLHYDEIAFSDSVQASFKQQTRALGKKRSKKNKNDCDEVDLTLFQQWEDEIGYWIGEYSFYGPDGKPFESSSWNYPYGDYRGFITSDAKGNQYRQRNVFLYPSQEEEKCPNGVSYGDGICGINGNTKIFFADQNTTKCLEDDYDGGLSGPYGDFFFTTTELIGQNNALLYQVWFKKEALAMLGIITDEDRIYQSQLTTITKSLDGTGTNRVRSAQSFDVVTGKASSASFYRETKVSKESFYEALQETLNSYNILESDTCAWTPGATGGTVSSGLDPGFEACVSHLEESFHL